MSRIARIPLVLTPQPEGGFTVTSPVLPELLTEGDSIDEVLENVRDALDATLELYDDLGKALPSVLVQSTPDAPITFDCLTAVS
ncbi:MAG TPA: type II toxin-antitoxin system HicB family antitoxin [Candidatus Hydrogenedentes bacterium]|nr:type II toxin-antitoxin system HicB family antitoxin [Candidatus Hydrogenedentota bacterium]HNT89782.1 type II toxin-antitoxin system HicB family antitoxin [Candidatus Hydrogenedentota bacterium]